MEFVRCRCGIPPILRVFVKPRLRPRRLQSLSLLTRFNSTLVQTPRTKSTDPLLQTRVTLRDYQEECIQSVLRYLDQGHKRLGVSLATGSGKTVIFTQLIDRIPPRFGLDDANRTLIIVHRRELVEQAARHCRLAYPDRTVEIEMGNCKASAAADITIASIRSLVTNDRIEKFNPDRYKLVLVDEAHHIVAPSYREVLGHFGLNEFSKNSPALVGVSATFSRFDGLKLGAAIDHIVYHKDYVNMIDEKWLANAVFTTVKSGVDLSGVRQDRFGDFSTSSLSRAVNTERANDITVRAWLANAADRKSTLVFCVDVEHVMQLTAKFREYGVDARYITGRTAREVRGEQLRIFKDQEYPVLLNCGLFTEGTDIPNIDCVLLARPTRSKNLLVQMIGRGLRLFPGKEDCHIIDMVATLETGVLSTPTLLGLHPDEILNKASLAGIKQSRANKVAALDDDDEGEPFDTGNATQSDHPSAGDDMSLTFTKYDSVFDLIQDAGPERYIRSLSVNAWVRVSENRYVLSDLSGWLTIEKEDQDENNKNDNDNTFRVKHVMKVDTPSEDASLFNTRQAAPFYTRPRTVATAPDLETAVHAADTYAKDKLGNHNSTKLPWRRNPATTSQLKILNKAKIRKSLVSQKELTRGQAADMITKLKFGGRKQFTDWQAKMKSAKRAEAKKKEFEELVRKDVKVGPVET